MTVSKESDWHVCLACGCRINPEWGEDAVLNATRYGTTRYRHLSDEDCQAALRRTNRITGNTARIGRYSE